MGLECVITAAGMGTRARPWSILLPKALLPLAIRLDGGVQLKPVVDIIVGNLAKAGCGRVIVVKRPDDGVLPTYLKLMWGMLDLAFVNQDEPRGFGDAAYRGLLNVKGDLAIIHADDGFITDPGYIVGGVRAVKEYGYDIVLFARHVSDARRYGVVMDHSPLINIGGLPSVEVYSIEEKPKRPKTSLALAAVYVVKVGKVNAALGKLTGSGGYVELTDALQLAIDSGAKALAIIIGSDEWISVGTPDDYVKAQLRLYAESLSQAQSGQVEALRKLIEVGLGQAQTQP